MKQAAVDPFTTLPDQMIEYILSFLPFKDATRTSILARRWRHLWASVPHMAFDEEDFLTSHLGYNPYHLFLTCSYQLLFMYDTEREERKRKEEEAKDMFINLVDRCLSLSTDALTSVRIEFHPRHHLHASTLDRWVRCILSKSSMKELDLRLWSSMSAEIPSSFLHHNISRGLCSLRTLHLRHVTIRDHSLSLLLENMVHLENLNVEGCRLEGGRRVIVRSQHSSLRSFIVEYCSFYWEELQIELPNLEIFEYRGSFVKFECLNVPSLSRAVFNFRELDKCLAAHLRKVLANIQHVHSLELCALFMLVVAEVESFRDDSVDFRLINLEELIIDAWETQRGVWFLLERCPNLKKLTIRGSHGWSSIRNETWEMLELPLCVVHHLKLLRMEGFGGSVRELKMVEIILKEASAIETMDIKFFAGRSHSQMLEIARKLMAYPREFKHVRIMVSW